MFIANKPKINKILSSVKQETLLILRLTWMAVNSSIKALFLITLTKPWLLLAKFFRHKMA